MALTPKQTVYFNILKTIRDNWVPISLDDLRQSGVEMGEEARSEGKSISGWQLPYGVCLEDYIRDQIEAGYMAFTEGQGITLTERGEAQIADLETQSWSSVKLQAPRTFMIG